jgi:hypothetical protein
VTFRKHYTREEARELLPQVRQWLSELVQLREHLEQSEQRIATIRVEGADLGGPLINAWARSIASFRARLHEFTSREILIKDLDRGLIDFPSFYGGKEVFLCWEQGEDDVEFWHDLDSGYAGREPLD